jgi:hypothetical protein
VSHIASLVVADRGQIAAADDLWREATWMVRGWSGFPATVTDPGWWLNIAVFEPAGLAWSMLTSRPGLVVAASAVTSFGIETLHAAMPPRIGDPLTSSPTSSAL